MLFRSRESTVGSIGFREADNRARSYGTSMQMFIPRRLCIENVRCSPADDSTRVVDRCCAVCGTAARTNWNANLEATTFEDYRRFSPASDQNDFRTFSSLLLRILPFFFCLFSSFLCVRLRVSPVLLCYSLVLLRLRQSLSQIEFLEHSAARTFVQEQ